MIAAAVNPTLAQIDDFGTKAGGGVSIGPGKVKLELTRDGRWIGLTPVWGDGRTLLSRGGVFVIAEDAGGSVVEFVNTVRENDMRSSLQLRSFEGATGGFRAPSLQPDDDRDDRIDEDRLDGVDNDNDGRIDEDFAAIGDEMWVSEYEFDDGDRRLSFHQEAYAWSLPNIDGVIMLSIWVRNTGPYPLRNVRTGVNFFKNGPFLFSDRDIESSTSGNEVSARGRVLIANERDGASVAILLLPAADGEHVDWLTGYRAGTDTSQMLLQRIQFENIKKLGPISPYIAPARRVDREHVYVPEYAGLYGMTQPRKILEPGDELRINIALVSAPDRDVIDRALANAFQTYLGDGDNRFIPPIVSVKPRVLWGQYRSTEESEPAIVIHIEALGDDPVTADQISYISGMDASSFAKRETRPGEYQLVIRGENARKILKKNERITIKGRLDTGEFFEAVLRPGAGATDAVTQTDAMTYWKTPGRLTLDLLSGSPNPFRQSTTIIYDVPSFVEKEDGTRLRTDEALRTSVKIYNVAGRLVTVLEDNRVGAGSYRAQWNAVDESGNPVASGVYYVKLQIEKKFLTKRLILLK
ncbi:MAG: T9SS type A sorting domain-containing protein [bacterium]|nr:T9SS type A sorting domain-containing protein [bacterium]